MVYLVAYITGTLANDLNTTRRALEDGNETLARRNSDLARLQKEMGSPLVFRREPPSALECL